MSDEKNDLELPKKPLGRWTQAFLQGGIGTGFGALASLAWQASLNWAHNRKQSFDKNRILDLAVGVGLISTIIGYVQGKGDAKLHEATVDNIKLQNKVEKLEAEKSETAKSFVKQVAGAAQSTDDPACSHKSR